MKQKTKSNNKKIHYSDGPINEIELIDDFLPKPKDLIRKEDVVKVTLTLDRETIKFFKYKAKIHKGQYQKMIRELLKQYSKKSA